MDSLYKDGKEKYPNGTEFEDKVASMSVKEVIAFVTDPVEKKKETTQTTQPVAPVAAAVGTGVAVETAPTKKETAEEKPAQEKFEAEKKEKNKQKKPPLVDINF